jgi:hypothetical protein
LVAALALGCGDDVLRPDRPGSTHEIRPGDTLTVDLAGTGHQLQLRFTPDESGFFALYLQALTGAVQVEIADSLGGAWLAGAGASAEWGLGLPDLRTDAFAVSAGRPYLVVVDQSVIEARGRSRLLLYAIRRDPETAPVRLTLGDTISAETIDPSADIDDFVFTAAAGQELIAFLAAPPGFRESALLAGVYPDRGSPFGRAAAGFVRNGPPSAHLQAWSSGRFTVPAAGDQYLTVHPVVPPYAPAAAHTGPYRVAVLAINRAPEQVGSTLAAGDTVNGEAVDHVGDIDEYSLALPAGTEVNVLFQATGSPATGLELELTDFAPASRLALSLAGDTGLTRQATGTVAVPATGLVRLRVQGRSDVVLDRGAYRLFPFVVKRAPETAGAALAPGDSVVNESIELPGDIDEFLLTVPAPVLLNIWFSALVPPVAGEPFVGGFRMEIENAATGEHLRTTNLFETGSAAGGVGTGPWLAGPATYRLRMAGAASTGQAFRGPYRLFSATSDSAPEGVPATIAIGDTVLESAEPLGDADLYQFDGRKGQVLRARFLDPGVPTGSGLLLLVGETIGLPFLGLARSGPQAPPFAGVGSPRMILPRDGTFRVLVGPENQGQLLAERGPYRFTISELSTAPELASPTLAPGDSVGNERLEGGSDVDDYLLSAPAGSELVTLIWANPGSTLVEVLDPATYDLLAQSATFGFPQSTTLVTVPASGTVLLRVYATGCPDESCIDAPATPYSLWAYTISRAPEQGPVLIAVGDTITDAIDPIGDIDEFEFDGLQGETLEAYFQAPNGTQGWTFTLALVDPLDGSVLGSVTTLNATAQLDDLTTGSITLPRDDRYRVRVSAPDGAEAVGPYRFRVRRP